MQRPGPQVTCVMLYAAGAALCVQQTSAAEWQVAPSAHAGASYADNPRLQADGGSASAGAVGEFDASFKRLTDRSELSLRPRLLSARYRDDPSLDSDDQFLTAGYRWLNERSEWSSEMMLTRDTTLTSELGQTGLVESNRRHEAVSLAVAPKVTLTERVSGGVQMYHVDNRYIDAELTGLIDYRYTALSLFSTVLLSDAGSSLTVTAQSGELSTSGFRGSDTRDATLRFGWTAQPWQLWTVALSGGPSMVETVDGNDTGAVFDAEIKRTGERWSLTTLAGRSQSPTGRGVLTQRDRISLSFSRSLTERLSAVVGAQWVRNEDLLPQAGTAIYRVDYGRLDLSASWRLSSEWSLSLQLRGSTQDHPRASERAEGHRATLSMVWTGQPQSL